MNNGGTYHFVARLLEEGLNVEWLRDLQRSQKNGLRSSASGLQRHNISDLHARGVLKKKSRDHQGRRIWLPGPHLADYIKLAELVQERQQKV